MKLTHWKQRLLGGALAAATVVSLTWAPASAQESYQESGGVEYPKLSKQEIATLLEEHPVTTPEHLFVEEPSVTAPYAAGQMTQEALQAATDRLSTLRRLAGLPSVELDLAYSQEAQYGAVLLAASSFSHYPSKPADMDDSFYNIGLSATSSSNIAAGYGFVASVDGFMDDSDVYNISALGHRRWQLNPSLGKVGFGMAYDNDLYGRYVAEKVFDFSSSGCNYNFIAWPASGNFPAQDGDYTLFNGSCAWSVTLNPRVYATPSLS